MIVYLPDCYDREAERRFPVVYVLHGFNETVDTWLERSSVYGNYLPAIDRLLSTRAMEPVIVVFIDGWSGLGGSQYVDSRATGRYQSYLLDDVVPWVDRRFRTLADKASRGIQGHSSGGLGALLAVVARPDLFSAVAASAPDALYEYHYPPIFARAARSLRTANATFDQWREGVVQVADEGELRMCQAIAACFSPGEDGQVLLPFDPVTGRLVDAVWERWLAFDPVRIVGNGGVFPTDVVVYLSVGLEDDYCLWAGAYALAHELRSAGVSTELMAAPTDHSGIVSAMPTELLRLATGLKQDGSAIRTGKAASERAHERVRKLESAARGADGGGTQVRQQNERRSSRTGERKGQR